MDVGGVDLFDAAQCKVVIPRTVEANTKSADLLREPFVKRAQAAKHVL